MAVLCLSEFYSFLTMNKRLLLLVIFFRFGFSAEVCPKYIVCETSQKGDSCPPGKFYRENVKVHNCCPGCVTLKDEGESCTDPRGCQPGLKLDSATKKCVKDPTQACEYYKRYDQIFKKNKYWKPLCLPDGTFAPKQCKGEKVTGKCFCVDKMGVRIFGEEDWNKADNMTCACSRLVDEMKQKGLKTNIHCDSWGNFEPLQCDQKTCWCANPTTGIPYTAVVPAEMMLSLPCHNPDNAGAQYHKQCDSGSRMQEEAVSLLRNHGTTSIILGSLKCNFDGSFYRVQTLRDKKRCVYINNSPITEYFGATKANCNCAFDKYVADLTKSEFLPECLPDGSYKNKQVWANKIYCLDEDGFYYSENPADCPK